MTENTYYKPRLIIGGKEIIKGMSGSVTFNGDSKLQTCQCKITDPDLQNFRLMNKKIEVYLNYGSDDGVPIFRGVIHEVTPSDNFTSIKALDVRNVLVGKSSRLLQLTDDENYDGYTLAAFFV